MNPLGHAQAPAIILTWFGTLLAMTSLSAEETPRPLLTDTAFAECFGAAFIYGKREEDGVVRSYRDQPQPELGQKRTVSRELRDMITTALRQAHEKQPALSTDPDDFMLSNFSIGLEGLGHWETDCEISGLSLSGTLAK